MKAKYLLIDCVYINSGGGLNILNEIIKNLEKKRLVNKCFFLLDKRLEINKIYLDLKSNCRFIEPNEKNRKNFYNEKTKHINSVLCLANVPPPIKIYVPVHIYFHNDLFLRPWRTHLSLKNKVLNYLKRLYIILKNKNEYLWHVQSSLMLKKVSKSLFIDKSKIHISPIFSSKKNMISNKAINTFLYVANYSKHKNHDRLLKSMIKSAKDIDHSIELHLTLPNFIFADSIYLKYKLPLNLKIINHGILDFNDLKKLYAKSEFLIFPSLNESFGLPLIEAIHFNCKILASDLPFVKEIIKASLLFNPLSVNSISEKILNAVLNKKIEDSKIIIENKIDTFVKDITQNV
tara:strand:+ start:394 stop:1434 length:1041 start_codon:yes stop_codon:yes gene_type:complete